MVTWHPIPHLSTLHLVWSSLETLMLYNQIYYDDKNIRSIFYFFSLFLCILSYYLDWYMFYIKICKLNTLFSKDAFRRILRQSQGKIMPFAFIWPSLKLKILRRDSYQPSSSSVEPKLSIPLTRAMRGGFTIRPSSAPLLTADQPLLRLSRGTINRPIPATAPPPCLRLTTALAVRSAFQPDEATVPAPLPLPVPPVSKVRSFSAAVSLSLLLPERSASWPILAV